MKANRGQVEKALRQPGAIRVFLLHGADESGSRALAALLPAALGADAERIDLSAAQLKSDPALLADEAASSALFGGPRHIRVDGAGDDVTAAVEALLEAPAAGNPVVIIAGTLRATSRLMKVVTAHPAAMAYASYVPSAADFERIAIEEGRAIGLRIDPAIARRLAATAGNDRAILGSELAKYALFLDATPDAPKELDHAALDALSADAGEADMDRLIDAVLGGDPGRAEAELARLAAIGTSGILIVRMMQRRLLQIAELRGRVEQGNSIATVLARPDSGVWRSQQDAMGRQLGRWTADRAATALERIAAAGRAAMSSRGPGELAIEAELGIIARNAARAR